MGIDFILTPNLVSTELSVLLSMLFMILHMCPKAVVNLG